jgi:hypothetical protein
MHSTEHEVAACGGVDPEGQMPRKQILAEGVAFDTGEDRGLPDEPVRVSVHKLKEVAAR